MDNMLNLAKFFRFCGYGVAIVSLILGVGVLSAIPSVTDTTPILFFGVGLLILFIFAVMWIVLSYRLIRDANNTEDHWTRLSNELEEFREESRQWNELHMPRE
jgi:uncharacterized membrane protein